MENDDSGNNNSLSDNCSNNCNDIIQNNTDHNKIQITTDDINTSSPRMAEDNLTIKS